MITIRFNAFSFLKNRCKDEGIECPNKAMTIDEEISVSELVKYIGLEKNEVEGVFVNHKLVSFDTVIKDGDRVALVPPGGIPGHVKAYVGNMGSTV